MKIFNRPENLNGAELIAELATAGIIVERIFQFGNGNIGIETDKESLAGQIVSAHNGTIVAPELTIEDKLAIVGLNLDDLKSALGLA